jgi:hypothetical protein
MATAEDCALLAAAAYPVDIAETELPVLPLPADWAEYEDPSSTFFSFDARVYFNATSDEFVIAFAGTNGGLDWVTGNVPAGVGIFAEQIREAINLYS